MESLDLAHQAAKTARNNFEEGDYNACANRSYYACFYAARFALLKIAGIETSKIKSHSTIIGLFALHFVKGSALDKAFSYYFSQTETTRHQADYSDSFLTKEEAKGSLEAMQAFLKGVEDLYKRTVS